MKTTAKMSLIIALALCITIGGVYATWSYVNHTFNTAADDVAKQVTIGITAADGTPSDLKRGEIRIEEGYTSAVIDQKGTGDYHAKLVWTGTPFMVSFVPNDTASNDGTEAPDAINVKYTITITHDGNLFDETFNGSSIFAATTVTGTLENVNETTPKELDLATLIGMADNFELGTLAIYDNFYDQIIDGHVIKIEVVFEDAGEYVAP